VLGTTELVALGCTRCSNCERGRGCPFGLTTTDPELQELVEPDWGAERLNNLFLYFKLQHMKPTFEAIALGSTVKTIGLDYFKKLRISVPARSEQDKAAEIMMAAEADMGEQRVELEKLRLLKSGLMDDLATGRLRLTRRAAPYILAAGVLEIGGYLAYIVGARDGVAIPASESTVGAGSTNATGSTTNGCLSRIDYLDGLGHLGIGAHPGWQAAGGLEVAHFQPLGETEGKRAVRT